MFVSKGTSTKSAGINVYVSFIFNGFGSRKAIE
jgi:hypothetical protein